MIKSLITAVSSGAVLLAFYGILGYKGKTAKAVGFVFALAFAVNLISVLPKNITLPDISVNRNISENIENIYRNEICNTVKGILDENEITYKSVTAVTEQTDGGTNLVCINIESNSDGEKIKALLPGLNVTVINYG